MQIKGKFLFAVATLSFTCRHLVKSSDLLFKEIILTSLRYYGKIGEKIDNNEGT